MQWRKSIAALAAFFMGIALTACGSGGGDGKDGGRDGKDGGGTTVSSLKGIALTGKALDGAYVAVIDSTGKQCNTTTDTDGKWTVLLENCGTAPYLIIASKNGDIFYSAATAADISANVTVNISQLTDAIVKVTLNKIAPTASDVGQLTDIALKDSNDVILKNLVPPDVLVDANVTTSINIRTSNVEVNSHKGLDKLSDRVIKIHFATKDGGLALLAGITKKDNPSEVIEKILMTSKSASGILSASIVPLPVEPITSSINLRKIYTWFRELILVP